MPYHLPSHYLLTPSMQAFVDEQAASLEPKLIDGPTGSGKSLLACVLHERGPRRKRRLRQLACGTLEPSLADAQLFGVVKGAFTGAERDRPGFLEGTDGGTFVLNDIDLLRPGVQAKLLGFLDTGRYTPVGSVEERQADVHLIATTNRNPEQLVAEGCLREDLYGRLSFVRFTCPPLAVRTDIRALAPIVLRNVWTARPNRGADAPEAHEPRLTPHALDVIAAHGWWPLNIRGLAQVLGDCMASAVDGSVNARTVRRCLGEREAMWERMARQAAPRARTRRYRRSGTHEDEKRMMEEALRRTGGNVTAAAERSGMSRTAFWYKLKEHGIERVSVLENKDGSGV